MDTATPVSRIMSRPVATVSMDTTLETIRGIFQRERFHHLVVLEHHRPVGVISDRDLLKNLSPYAGKFSERAADAATLQRKAHQVMTRNIIAVDPDDDVTTAASTMLDKAVSCLPVVDDRGALVGIITWRDLLRAAFDQDANTADDRHAA